MKNLFVCVSAGFALYALSLSTGADASTHKPLGACTQTCVIKCERSAGAAGVTVDACIRRWAGINAKAKSYGFSAKLCEGKMLRVGSLNQSGCRNLLTYKKHR